MEKWEYDLLVQSPNTECARCEAALNGLGEWVGTSDVLRKWCGGQRLRSEKDPKEMLDLAIHIINHPESISGSIRRCAIVLLKTDNTLYRTLVETERPWIYAEINPGSDFEFSPSTDQRGKARYQKVNYISCETETLGIAPIRYGFDSICRGV